MNDPLAIKCKKCSAKVKIEYFEYFISLLISLFSGAFLFYFFPKIINYFLEEGMAKGFLIVFVVFSSPYIALKIYMRFMYGFYLKRRPPDKPGQP
jgi:hypothetical protein